MPKQLNIIITDEEAEKLNKLRSALEFPPSMQGFARQIFRRALALELDAQNVGAGRRAR